MKLTEFIFFKNTPLNDFQNTIHFKNNTLRDNHFLNTDFYEKIKFNSAFNYARDRLTLTVSLGVEHFDGVNYCSFLYGRDNKRYYAFVDSAFWAGGGGKDITKVRIIMDEVMTYTQGRILNTLENIEVVREHLTPSLYSDYLLQLRTNDDVLKTTTKSYVHQDIYKLGESFVLFQSSVDLTKKFGKREQPVFDTTEGDTVDNITGATTVYIIYWQYFKDFLKIISPYPWISRNFSKIQLVPFDFVDQNDLEKVKMSITGFNDLYKFKNNTKSKNKVVSKLQYSERDLCDIYGINYQFDLHLLRNEYTTLEFYTWDGQQLLIDNAFVDRKNGVKLQIETMYGYYNEFRVFLKDYKTTEQEKDINLSSEAGNDNKLYKGTFLNNSLVFSTFVEIPTLINTGELRLAESANTRSLTESKLITNRLQNVANPKADLTSRLYDSMSLLSDVSISGIFGKFRDEREYYRTQEAQNKDLALSSPTISPSSQGNSFQLANDLLGVTVKMSAPSKKEMEKIKKYYALFGFEINENGTSLSNVESMTIANYVEFKGNWNIPNVPRVLMEQLRIKFENGVRLWHDDGTRNPMLNNILENRMWNP